MEFLLVVVAVNFCSRENSFRIEMICFIILAFGLLSLGIYFYRVMTVIKA